MSAQSISEKEKAKILNYLLKKASKLDCFDKKVSYKTLMIYWFDYRHLTKEDFKNETLMGSLEIIRERKKKWPVINLIIYDDNDRVIAHSANLNIFCVYKFTYYTEILEYFLEHKPDILFRISGTDGSIYFSKKGNQITVLEFGSKGLVEYSLEDYKNCCWDTFLPPILKE